MQLILMCYFTIYDSKIAIGFVNNLKYVERLVIASKNFFALMGL